MQIQCAATPYDLRTQCRTSLLLNLQYCRDLGIESLEGRRLKADGQWTPITDAVRARSILMS